MKTANETALFEQGLPTSNAMINSCYKPIDYVRQLDKTAMKNCMELALKRHEQALSVRQDQK